MPITFSFSSQRASCPLPAVSGVGHGNEEGLKMVEKLDPAFVRQAEVPPEAPVLPPAPTAALPPPLITQQKEIMPPRPPAHLPQAPKSPFSAGRTSDLPSPFESLSLPVQPRRLHESDRTEKLEVSRDFSNAPTTRLVTPTARGMTTTAALEEPGTHVSDLAAQAEQLRSDLFSAATTISALSDRIEMLEGRLQTALQTSQKATAEVEALRADIRRWLTDHLDAAVEQRMRAIWMHYQSSQAPAAESSEATGAASPS